jgi:hypothetical protein
MPVLVLEVNDAGLQVLSQGRTRPSAESPGIALFEGGALLTGAAAAARAQLRPRAVCDTYWDHLDTEPLKRPYPARVSHADLAFAHLRAMGESLGPGETEVILAVPGFWTPASLALLLSVTRAAGLDVRGLVDSAVAGACFAPRTGRLLHLDLTRHRAVLTTLDGRDGTSRLAVADTSGLGTAAFDASFADHFTRRFVAETRYDPRHSGGSDQALHDAIPLWLRDLRSLPSCPAALAAGGREHTITISIEDFARAGKALQARLAEEVLAQAGAARPLLVLSARASRQPGLSAHLREHAGLEVFELPYDAAVLAAQRHHPRIRHEGDALPFVTRLPGWDSARAAAAPGPREGRPPTHLVHAGVAHVLAPDGLTLGQAPPPGRRGLALHRDDVAPHHGSLLCPEGDVVLEVHAPEATSLNGAPVTGRVRVRAGDRLRLGTPGVELLFVALDEPKAP